MVMSACFKDDDFRKTEFILLLLFTLALLLLSPYLHYLYTYLFYTYFNVIVVVSILPVFITVDEPCTICSFTNLVPCPVGIHPYTTFKTKFVQNIFVT